MEIEETLRRTVTVYAEDIEDAFEKVKNVYQNGEVILDSNDLVNVTYLSVPTFKREEN